MKPIPHVPGLSVVMLLLALLLRPASATSWEWLGIDDYLRLADLIAIIEVEEVDSEYTSQGYVITSGRARIVEPIFSRWNPQPQLLRIYDLDTQAAITQGGGQIIVSQSSPWRIAKGKFFVILKGSEVDGYRPFDRFSLQSLERNMFSLAEDTVLIPREKAGQKEQRTVRSAEAAAAFRERLKVRPKAGTLQQRMDAVILADAPSIEGTTPDQQFCNGLQKISDGYKKHWRSPLPLWIDPTLLVHLQTAQNFRNITAIPIRDAPLSVMLRYWCGFADATYRAGPDGVYISRDIKP